jgi:drug/metabolite transporter (DMT)-like permease
MSENIARNVRWGMTWGLAMAAGFSLYVIVLTVLRGSPRFDAYGMTTWTIIVTYFGAGIVAGSAIGFLRPLTRWWWGAILTGAIGGMCVYGAISYAMDGRVDLVFALVIGIPVGGTLGLTVFRDKT